MIQRNATMLSNLFEILSLFKFAKIYSIKDELVKFKILLICNYLGLKKAMWLGFSDLVNFSMKLLFY